MLPLTIFKYTSAIFKGVIIFGFMAFCFSANAQTSIKPPGDGIEVPFQISKLDHLFWLSQNSEQWSADFVQTADIDASPTSEWNGGEGFSPIGNTSVQFKGTYDAQGHHISGLTINCESVTNVGFFGDVQSATIKNLGLNNVNISSLKGKRTGGVVGSLESGTLSKCFVSGSIYAKGFYLGGMAGVISEGSKVSHCYSLVNLSGELSGVGGLIGYKTASTITHSYSNGSVDNNNSYGKNGGLVGINGSGDLVNCYWNIESSGQEESGAGVGLYDTEMRRSINFESWDFSTIWGIEEGNTFPFLRDNIPTSLPGFESFEGGNGSVSNPYQVNSTYRLHQIRNYADHHFIQTDNIDMSTASEWDNGKGFEPIGNSVSPFTGRYDGQGYLIRRLKMDRPVRNEVALFGYFTGTLSGIGVISADIQGQNGVGVLVGSTDLDGIIDHCYSSGRVQGNSGVGGITGNLRNGLISNSYSVSDISGLEAVGGLSGSLSSQGTIEKSYSTGSVSGNSNTGGLLGLNEGGIVTDSYWNIESSGQPGSAGGSGLKTTEMKQQSSYNGWDFIGSWEISNGNSFPNLLRLPIRSLNHVIEGEAGWRMYGSPFYNSTFETVVGNFWTQGYPESNNPFSETNLFTWSEELRSWEPPVSQSSTLKAGQGFIIYVYKDDEIDTPGVQGGFPKSIIHNDMITNTLPMEIPLSYSESGSSSIDGFNLAANPVSKSIDWEQLNKTNIANTYYLWDAANREYDIYQTGVGGVNGGTRIIEPFQGYWVRAVANPATLSIDSSAVVSYETASSPAPSKQRIYNTLLLQLQDDVGESDEVRIVIREDADAGLDEMDAVQLNPLSSSYLSLYSLAEANWLKIDSRPPNGTNPIVFDLSAVRMNPPGELNYKLSLAEDRLSDWIIELKDLKTGSKFNLRNDPVDVRVKEQRAKNSSMTMAETSTISEPDWQLVLTPTTTKFEKSYSQLPKQVYLGQNYPNPFNPATTICYEIPVDGQVSLSVSDLMGRNVVTLINDYHKAGRYEVNFNASHLASGVYMYSLFTPSGNLHRRMTIIK